MKGIFASLGVFMTLTRLSFANLDVISLYTKSDAWIQEAVATLIVGDVPNPITGDVALWTGIMTDKRDFLQGVTQNSAQRYALNLPNTSTSLIYKATTAPTSDATGAPLPTT